MYHADAKASLPSPADVTPMICVSMIDSVCPRTYSSGDPIKTLVCCCLCFLEPTECHVGQNCFGYSTSSELTVLVTFSILPRLLRVARRERVMGGRGARLGRCREPCKSESL